MQLHVFIIAMVFAALIRKILNAISKRKSKFLNNNLSGLLGPLLSLVYYFFRQFAHVIF